MVADVLLTDGGIATIRPFLASDASAVQDLHDRASDASLRLRFFVSGRRAASQYVDHLVHDEDHIALVATLGQRVLGLATAELFGPDSADVGFLVDDAERGRGLASLLLEHLAAAARDRGIRHFHADVLFENHLMLDVFAAAGFRLTRQVRDGLVSVEIDTDAVPAAVAAADLRMCHAEAASLDPLVRPRSVAVVGVRRDGSGVGAAVLRSIRSGPFTGEVRVVHPGGGEVLGVPTVTSLAASGEPIDLVVVAVPAARVLDVLRDAAQAHARVVVVVTSGFREMGAEGAALEASLLRIARDAGIRLVGPNGLGVLANTVGLNATFTDAVPPVGGLAIASQSGGVGIVLLDRARAEGLGVHSLVSLGNKADVSGNDLLAAWTEDPEITAAAFYLEGFGNAPRFARLARRFTETKPLLAVIGGRSAGGRRAGASHTAAAASSSVGVAALFRHCGIIGCDGAEELVAVARLLADQPRPAGRRVGILSNAGGMGVLAADLAEGLGLAVPPLSATTSERLGAAVSGTTGTGNPVDVGAGASATAMSGAATVLLESGEVDALLVVLVRTALTDVAGVVTALGRARRTRSDVPVLLVSLGGPDQLPDEPGLTAYRSCDEALGALAAVERYAAWLAVPPQAVPDNDVERSLAVQRRCLELLRDESADGWVGPDGIRDVLDRFAIAPVGATVGSAEATAAAGRLGFPVVVKVAEPEIVHRTERRLVRVGLRSAGEVDQVLDEFAEELGRDDVRVSVQPVLSGVEIAVGLVRDPVFGPLVMVAAGGIAVDVWDDRTFLMAPFSAAEAERALRGLRIWPLLAGHRGSAPADLEALVALVVSVGQLAVEAPQVAELDLNPVLASPEGVGVVDAKLRLSSDPTRDGVLREL